MKMNFTVSRTSAGVLALAALGFGGSAEAATLYVSTAGNDANACTLAQPCRQVTRALQIVAPGDTIQVADGTYNGFTVTKSATAALPIRIVSPGRMAEILPSPGRDDTILVQDSTHVEIDGFRSFNSPDTALHVSGGHHITIRNGVFGNNVTFAILTGHSDDLLIEDNECFGSTLSHGLYVANSGDRPVVRRNRIHDNARNGLHMNGDIFSPPGDGIISGAVVEANIIYNNSATDSGTSGINMDGVQDSIIRNNLIYNNFGTGIKAYQVDGGGGPKGLQIYNNTVDMPSNGRNGISIRNSDGANTLRNNISIARNAALSGIKYGDANDIALASSNFNILDRVEDESVGVFTLTQWKANHPGHETNSFSASPASLWVNTGAGDYHLLTTSPAVNTGTTLATVPTDLEGTVRPQGAAYDIGAYERLQSALSVSDVSVNEGPPGTVTATFLVTLSFAAAGTVTVDYTTANNTAVAPGDYVSASGTLTFTPGQTSKPVAVTVNGDITDETNETFFLNLTNISAGATLADPQGVGTIVDDDPNADVSVTKTNGVSSVTVGQNLTYTIVVANAGPNDANGVTVTDSVPASLTGVSWTCAGAAGGVCGAAGGNGSISQAVNLPVGSSVTYSLMATVAPSAGTVVNTAAAAVPLGFGDPNPANNSATDQDVLICAAETVIVPDGRVTSHTVAGNGTAWFLVSLRTTGSYTVEIRDADGQNAPGALTVLRGEDGCGGTSTLVINNTAAVSPAAGSAARRLSFRATGSDGNYHLRVVNESAGAQAFTLMVAETTLYSASWSTNGTFESYYSFQNTTNVVLNGTLRFKTAAGASAGAFNIVLPANRTTSVNTQALGVAGNLAGTVEFVHDGPPGAILGTAAIANFTSIPAYVQPVKLGPVREVR